MVRSLDIKNLFGRFNYKISLNSSGVTIITGPNGFGKSTILKIVSAIANTDLFYFMRLDFQSIEVQFENARSISLIKNEKTLLIDGMSVPLDLEKYLFSDHRRRVPWLRKNYIRNGWIDMRSDKSISDDELLSYLILKDVEGSNSENFIDNKELKEKIICMKKWSGEVRLISEQRLIREESKIRDDNKVINVISELPQRLKSRISEVTEEYSAVANKLDSSYPKRLFAAKEGLDGRSEYRIRLDEANKKFEKLNKYNLVDMSLIDEQNYQDFYSTALKIYFDDFSEKYKVFEDLIEKLDLFTKIINERLMFKQIRISRKNGFEIIDSDNTDKILKLSQLSSGEKQEIVLFYDLIFNTKSNYLLLIDEPEISLHITWQKKFLNDLLEVAKNASIQAMVATHSPQIVSDHWDIQIDLGELHGKLN